MNETMIEIDGPPHRRVRMLAVQSSAINSYGYCREDQSLYVLYRSGGLYRYAGVPESEVAALAAASSKGTQMVAIRKSYVSEIIDSTQWRGATQPETVAVALPAVVWGNVRLRDCWL